MIDFYTQIEDYLEGRLPNSERQAFEAELAGNEELKHAVDNHDVMDEVLDILWEDDAREVAMKARESAEEIDFGDENNVIPLRRLMSYAASLVALVVVGFLVKQQLTTSPESEIQYAAFYSEFQPPFRRGENNDLSNLSLCDKGHALMDTEEFNLAVETFKKSMQTIDDCLEKSQWYLTLCYLKLNQVEQRDSLLNVIKANASHKYSKNANDLSEKL